MTHRATDQELEAFAAAAVEASQGNSSEAINTMIDLAQNWDTHDDYSGDHLLADMKDS